MNPKSDPSNPSALKTHIAVEELTELVFPMPDAPPKIFGDKLNKSQLAKAHSVSLVTVDNWVRRGCPVAGRDGRELVFDSFRVLLWYEVRKNCDASLLAMDRQQITAEIESAHHRLFLWLHSDSARFEDPQLRAALHLCGGVEAALKGWE